MIDAVRADERIGRRKKMERKRGRVQSLKEHPHLTSLVSCLRRTTHRPLLAQPSSSATALTRPTLTGLPLTLIPSIKKYQMPPEGSRRKKDCNSQDYSTITDNMDVPMIAILVTSAATKEVPH